MDSPQHPTKLLSNLLPDKMSANTSGVERGWADWCLHQLVEARAKSSPTAVAVEHESDRLTYAELNGRANQFARFLGAQIPPKSFVGVCLPSSIDFVVASLAILKAGCTCVPLDPKYPADRLAYMVEDASVSVVFANAGLAGRFSSARVRLIDPARIGDEVRRQSAENCEMAGAPSDIAYLIYTSGSTGKPRGVLLAHAGLANYNLAAANYYRLSAKDRVLQFCSLSFDAALEEIFATLVAGATLVLRSAAMPLDVPGFLSWVSQKKISVLDLPTAYWHEWASQFGELSDPVPNCLRLVIVGGEKALAGALATWRKHSRVRWVNTYGPTEASIAVTRYDPDEEHSQLAQDNIPTGRAIENCEIYVLDSNQRAVPHGVPGELYIGGVSVAHGYLNRPELTAEKFILNPF